MLHLIIYCMCLCIGVCVDFYLLSHFTSLIVYSVSAVYFQYYQWWWYFSATLYSMKYLQATERKTQHLMFTSGDPTGRVAAWSTRTSVPFSAAVNRMTVSFGEAVSTLERLLSDCALSVQCSTGLRSCETRVCIDGRGHWEWPRRCPVNLFTWF